MSIFDDVKNIFTGIDFKLSSPYMINRLLSFVPETFVLSANVNRYLGRLPDWALKSIYYNCIPKRRAAPFINYAKTPKHTDQRLVEKIEGALCCSTFHAQQVLKILQLYGHKPHEFFGLKKGE